MSCMVCYWVLVFLLIFHRIVMHEQHLALWMGKVKPVDDMLALHIRFLD